MANVLRFTLPTARDLNIAGVGNFEDGVLDVPVNDLEALSRARYRVQPYGAVEVGIVPEGTAAPSLPAVPGPANPDPYPQYPTMDEIVASPALKAASVALLDERLPREPQATLGNQLTKVGVILDTGTTGAFDAGRVEGLSVVYAPENGRLAGLYVGYDGAVQVASLGLAWTDDGVTWSKAGQVFTGSGAAGTPDQYGVTGPRIIYEGGLYWLFYIGLDAAGYEAGTKRLCLASTPSLTSPAWTRYGAILTPGGSGWRAGAVYRASNPVKVDGVWHMLINCAGPGPGLLETIGHATAPAINGPWTFDDAASPVIGNAAGSEIAGDPYLTKLPGGWRVDFFRAVRNTWTRDYYATTTDDAFPGGWTVGNGGNPILVSSETYDAKYAGKPDIYRLAGRTFHAYVAVSASDHRCVALAVDPPLTAKPNLATVTVSGTTTTQRLESLLSALRSFGAVVINAPAAADTFTRADSTSLGSTEVGSKPWVTSGTGWAITSNRLAFTGTADATAMVDSGLADNYDIDFVATTVSGQYPLAFAFGSSATSHVKVFRDQTGNFWAARDSAAGAGSQVQKTVTADLASGDAVKLRKQGTTLTLFINGAQVAQWTGYTYHNTSGDTFQGVLAAANMPVTVDSFAVTPY